ncbi:type II toxin-antitoxin system ParD family antitoxin [Aliirhizobium terrae]|uniref:ribbon-helix-helix domain-containing protein n=1 Tax=Terrirhizobium terrae TaxID=2926709 RepID=UPI00257600DD|nr:type II toxin-antitoxin system ParD family antitoxin [Rhizobium sp. CC-CFT758]WJH39920.1 type II toxin-antitoxin system ParD family antitoxin [Rhizobium sp. CC-CFT758]
MTQLQKVSIDLPSEVTEIIEQAVASGEFASVSEVVTNAVATWQTSRLLHGYTAEELRAMVAEADGSGEPISGAEALRQIDEEFEREFGRKL